MDPARRPTQPETMNPLQCRGFTNLRRRNFGLAVGALHQAGRPDTTEATRWASRYMERPLIILGLTYPRTYVILKRPWPRAT